jgi:hypothetical protein
MQREAAEDWTHLLCERCSDRKVAEPAHNALDDDTCCRCGAKTRSAIFARAEPGGYLYCQHDRLPGASAENLERLGSKDEGACTHPAYALTNVPIPGRETTLAACRCGQVQASPATPFRDPTDEEFRQIVDFVYGFAGNAGNFVAAVGAYLRAEEGRFVSAGAWTHLVCERCWNILGGRKIEEPPPSDVGDPCCRCGAKTRSGIFYRADPASMLFCAHDRLPESPAVPPDVEEVLPSVWVLFDESGAIIGCESVGKEDESRTDYVRRMLYTAELTKIDKDEARRGLLANVERVERRRSHWERCPDEVGDVLEAVRAYLQAAEGGS